MNNPNDSRGWPRVLALVSGIAAVFVAAAVAMGPKSSEQSLAEPPRQETEERPSLRPAAATTTPAVADTTDEVRFRRVSRHRQAVESLRRGIGAFEACGGEHLHRAVGAADPPFHGRAFG